MSDPGPGARVFAYGSNLNLPALRAFAQARGVSWPDDLTLVPALLPDHRLVWNYRSPIRQAGAANVEAAPGETLPGGLLTVPEDFLPLLDAKEGHPHRYLRTRRPVVRLGGDDDHGSELAWVYEVTEAWRRAPGQWPTADYLRTIVEGAEALGLPAAHLAALRSTPAG